MTVRFFVALLITLLTFSTANAAKVDIYRNAIQNKTFTLKYKVNEFPVRVSNREMTLDLRGFKPHVYSTDTLHLSGSDVDTGGIIVIDGKNSYIENFHDAYKTTAERAGSKYVENIKAGGICALTKNGEVFNFFWEMKDGAKRYYGSETGGMMGAIFDTKSNKVKAISEAKNQENIDKYAKYVNPYDILYNDYSYGNAELAQALSAVLPADRIIATSNTPVYRFAGSGTLDDGLSYEDFSSEKNGTFYAIRYYFSGDKMVKIATFNYTKIDGSIVGYEKYVIDIEEFSTSPDESYLQLPSGLTDATKRGKDGGKK